MSKFNLFVTLIVTLTYPKGVPCTKMEHSDCRTSAKALHQSPS